MVVGRVGVVEVGDGRRRTCRTPGASRQRMSSLTTLDELLERAGCARGAEDEAKSVRGEKIPGLGRRRGTAERASFADVVARGPRRATARAGAGARTDGIASIEAGGRGLRGRTGARGRRRLRGGKCLAAFRVQKPRERKRS
jgi:hypothetical protein|eukprot:30996-Pelagococcus_subviridis.AAC.15